MKQPAVLLEIPPAMRLRSDPDGINPQEMVALLKQRKDPSYYIQRIVPVSK